MLTFKMPITNYFKSIQDIRPLAIILSLLISVIVYVHQQPFNIDGIKYLDTARAFLAHGMKAAMHVYDWPFYSILIAFTHKITSLSLINSAFLLNSLLTAIIIYAFISIVREFSKSISIQWFALLLILSYPTLFSFRYDIMRGYGYLACNLLAILALIYFIKKLQWRYALLWGVLGGIASLFRIEGVLIQALIPVVILFREDTPWPVKFYNFFKLHVINILVLISFSLFLFYFANHNLGRLTEFKTILLHPFAWYFAAFKAHVASLRHDLFSNPIVYKNAPMFFIGGVLFILVASIIVALNVFYSLFVLHGIAGQLLKGPKQAKLVLYAYLIVNLLIVSSFIFNNLFLTGRYLMLFSLLLLIYASFSLDKIYHVWLEKKSTLVSGQFWLFPVAIFFFVFFSVGEILKVGPSKTYIIQAGKWLHQEIPYSKPVFFNNIQLRYYAQRDKYNQQDFNYGYGTLPISQLTTINLNKYDFIAVQINKDQRLKAKMTLKKLPIHLEKTFVNNRDDVVWIYKVLRQKAKKG